MIMLNTFCNCVTSVPSLREQVSLLAGWLRLKNGTERLRLVSHPCFSIVVKGLIGLLVERAVLETVIDDICTVNNHSVGPCIVTSRAERTIQVAMFQNRYYWSLIDESHDHLLTKANPPSCLPQATLCSNPFLCADECVYRRQVTLLIVAG